MPPRLSLVVGFRDRDLERVTRLLDSLIRQSCQDFELLFVDYGSRPELSAAARALVERAPFGRYLASQTRGHAWSRSQALNIGGRRARGELLATTDVDMIFDPGVVEALLHHANDDRVVYGRVHFLPRGFRDWGRVSDQVGKVPVSGPTGLGGLCCLPTARFREIRGFDEHYRYWGIEDRDLNLRLRRLGMKEVWMEGAPIFHQWHPRQDEKTSGFLPLGVWGRNELHYLRHQSQVARNTEDWGRILKEEDRLALDFLDAEGKRLAPRADLHRLDLRPYGNRELARCLRAFWDLQSGHALALGRASIPHKTKSLTLLIRVVNAALRQLGIEAEIDYRINQIHSFLPELIQAHEELLADHYLDLPFGLGVSILVRA